MSVNICIQKIQIVEGQILTCKVQNTHLKSLVFKLNRKVELGSRTIKYLQYYYNEMPEKFNSRQTSNTLIGFLASLESNYQYINPIEDSKGGFFNQLLGVSEDNVKREFYFLLQGLDESIIEVQDILERILFITFNELPGLDTLLASPTTGDLSLSSPSTPDEALSNINDHISSVKYKPNLESSVEINTVPSTNKDQEKSKSETISLPTEINKIDIKLDETTPEVKQPHSGSNISKLDSSSSDSTEFQEKEEVSIQKSDLEINTANDKIGDQTLNNENITEIQANNEDTNNAQQEYQNNYIPMQMPTIPQQFLPNPVQYSYPEYPSQQQFAYPPIQAYSPVQYSYPGYPSQHQFAYPPSQVSSPVQPTYSGPIYNNPYPPQPIYYISPNYNVPETQITQTLQNYTPCESQNFNHPSPSQTPPLPPRRFPISPQAQSSVPNSLPSGPKIPPPLPERRTSKPSPTQPITESSSNSSPCESPNALNSSPVQTPPLPPRKPSNPAPKRRNKPLPTPPVLQPSTA
jgi:hypothetical protein